MRTSRSIQADIIHTSMHLIFGNFALWCVLPTYPYVRRSLNTFVPTLCCFLTENRSEVTCLVTSRNNFSGKTIMCAGGARHPGPKRPWGSQRPWAHNAHEPTENAELHGPTEALARNCTKAHEMLAVPLNNFPMHRRINSLSMAVYWQKCWHASRRIFCLNVVCICHNIWFTDS